MAIKVKLGTVLRNFNGEPLTMDLTATKVLAALNWVLGEISARDPALATELEQGAERMLERQKQLATLGGVILAVARADLSVEADADQIFSAALSCVGAAECTLPEEQVAALSRALPDVYRSPLVIGQVRAMLAGKDPIADRTILVHGQGGVA